jgi:hypothetical protein
MKRAIVVLIVAVLARGIGALTFLKIAREDPTAKEKFVARTARIQATTRRPLEGPFTLGAIDGAQRESTDGST